MRFEYLEQGFGVLLLAEYAAPSFPAIELAELVNRAASLINNANDGFNSTDEHERSRFIGNARPFLQSIAAEFKNASEQSNEMLSGEMKERARAELHALVTVLVPHYLRLRETD
ncbi:hypothetical protein AB0M43_18750 [Longispora sp. NPDC051575]|uniref:hypothetical protein n=1 Tax=Longispora sp. NPDC051575 TaxID=3154943 RepID=UPI0034296798